MKNNILFNTIIEKINIDLSILFLKHNINRERVELFHDFIFTLFDNMETTFLGYDILINEEDKINHFNWCWIETINQFKKENIFFNINGIHYDFLLMFFKTTFYDKDKNDIDVIYKLFEIFKFKFNDMSADFNLLNYFYKIIDTNLIK